MKLRLRRRGVRWGLAAFGLAVLGYCGAVLADAWWFQREATVAFAEELSPVVATPVRVAAERIWGRVAVERLGLSVIVLEGTSAATLQRAAGHIAGTAMPGEPGNVGISGHRDTFFFPLRLVRTADVVTVTTRAGAFRYRVVSVTVVQPDDTGVLDADETQVLTLVTCYPFTFIGSAPERFIVRAERVI